MTNSLSSYAICRGSIAFVWFYQGLAPKLLGPHEDELAMNLGLGLSESGATQLAMIGGVLEVIFAGIVMVFWRHRWPLVVTAVAMVVLLLYVCVTHPPLLVAAFNPVVGNLCVFALAIVALRLHGEAGKARSEKERAEKLRSRSD